MVTDINIDLHMVWTVIQHLSRKRSEDEDVFYATLKEGGECLTYQLCLLVNLSFSVGVVPLSKYAECIHIAWPSNRYKKSNTGQV